MAEKKLDGELKGWSQSYVEVLLQVARKQSSDEIRSATAKIEETVSTIKALHQSVEEEKKESYASRVESALTESEQLLQILAERLVETTVAESTVIPSDQADTDSDSGSNSQVSMGHSNNCGQSSDSGSEEKQANQFGGAVVNYTAGSNPYAAAFVPQPPMNPSQQPTDPSTQSAVNPQQYTTGTQLPSQPHSANQQDPFSSMMYPYAPPWMYGYYPHGYQHPMYPPAPPMYPPAMGNPSGSLAPPPGYPPLPPGYQLVPCAPVNPHGSQATSTHHTQQSPTVTQQSASHTASDANHQSSSGDDTSQHPHGYHTSHTSQTSQTTFQQPQQSVNASADASTQGSSDLERTLIDHLKISRLPVPEPDHYHGDPLEFTAWMVSFNALIMHAAVPKHERIYYLQRYVKGKALQAISELFLSDDPRRYDFALAILKKRFGDPFVIAQAYKDKLDEWKFIPANDVQKLLNFNDYLNQCLLAQSKYPTLAILDFPSELKELACKLPYQLINRWNREVGEKVRRYGHPPRFNEFVQFVNREAELAASPLLACRPQPSNHRSSNKPSKKDQASAKSFSTGASEAGGSGSKHQNSSATSQSGQPSKRCAFCDKQHKLADCERFTKLDMSAKQDFIRARRLCFACLKGGHGSRVCNRRLKCSTCDARHPTCLHPGFSGSNNSNSNSNNKPSKSRSDKPDKQEKSSQGPTKRKANEGNEPPDGGSSAEASSYKTSCQTYSSKLKFVPSSVCTMIVPVFVHLQSHPDRRVKVYAMLDSQSDASFVSQALADKLGAEGTSTKLSLTTMGGTDHLIDCKKIHGLLVGRADLHKPKMIQVSSAYTRDCIPASTQHVPTPEKVRRWPHLQFLQHTLQPLADLEVAMLIGYDTPEALRPIKVVSVQQEAAPYAIETVLGWSVVGDTGPRSSDDHLASSNHLIYSYDRAASNIPRAAIVLRASTSELLTPQQVDNLLQQGYHTESCDDTQSQDDRRFLQILDEKTVHTDNRYTIPLPFVSDNINLPNNRFVSLHRANTLKKRLLSDKVTKQRYCDFMEDLFASGYAEEIPSDDPPVEGSSWFLAHHGVYSASKPDKLRVVFDASARCRGTSLNDVLLGGPDLNNSLTGVLTRFRREQIAIVCDVQKMFLQFQVPQQQRNMLCFWWWQGHRLDGEPTIHRMCSHVFGAKSSPSCAVYGLHRIATDYQQQYSKATSDAVLKNFYVDDALCCVPTEGEAIQLIDEMQHMLAHGSLKLHKFVTNSEAVNRHLKLESPVQSLEVPGAGSVQKTLGVRWDVPTDSFQFSVDSSNKPLTRRSILSYVSSIFDPLGLISPFVLEGRNVLQSLCRSGLDWDEKIPEEAETRYSRWSSSLVHLRNVSVSRCLKPRSFGDAQIMQIHVFVDASSQGIGAVAYLRIVNSSNRVHCSLLAAKSRVVPSPSLTIPRLELMAALVGVKLGSKLKTELDLPQAECVFWSDSKVALGYISNSQKRFHVFVSNRVAQIRERSDVNSWHHVDTKQNPADYASRGLEATPMQQTSHRVWFEGPEFIWKQHITYSDEVHPVQEDDPEVKVITLNTHTQPHPANSLDLDRLKHVNSWQKLLRVVALCSKFKELLQAKIQGNHISMQLTAADLQSSSQTIVRAVQVSYFQEELEVLQKQHKQVKHSNIRKLDPFVDAQGILRVGGRLTNSSLQYHCRHPALLPAPNKCHVSRLLVQHYHQQSQHQGRHHTAMLIRSNGYWMINCASSIRHVLDSCYLCKRLYAPVQMQKMADLPKERVTESAAFDHVGVDMFGPFTIKSGRKSGKRYAALFTCFASRGVHLEMVHTLSTDSFISALRRFMAIRGPVKTLKSDQGTNFVGACAEICEDSVRKYLLSQGGDLLAWTFNVPKASHFGGVWERQIRSARRILASLLHQVGQQLTDETLQTVLYEVAAIVNSRPLTTESTSDCTAPVPISPNNLLTGKSCVTLLPPGEFSEPDTYSRKHWRRVQYFLNVFWSRWKLEYLQTLQTRQKWAAPHPNLAIGDVVLIKDHLQPHTKWPMAKVVGFKTSSDGAVRSVKVLVGTRSLDRAGKRMTTQSYLERPVHKLVVLVRAATTNK